MAGLVSGDADSVGERGSAVVALFALRVACDGVRDRTLGACDVKADGGRLCSSARRCSLSDSMERRCMMSLCTRMHRTISRWKTAGRLCSSCKCVETEEKQKYQYLDIGYRVKVHTVAKCQCGGYDAYEVLTLACVPKSKDHRLVPVSRNP